MPRFGSSARWWSAPALGMLLLLWVGAAHAQSTTANRIAIEEFDGKGANGVRVQIIAALERQGYDLVGARDIAAAQDRLGLDLRADADYAALALELDVTAVITGRMGRSGRDTTAEIGVRNGADGRELEAVIFKARKLPALTGVVKQRAWDSLRGPLQRAEVPRAALPAPLDPALINAQPPTAVPLERLVEELNDDGDASQPPLLLEAGPGILTRQLNYTDDRAGVLRPYSSGVHPTLNLRAAWFPGAHATRGPAADIGLLLGYQHVFIAASQTSDGAEFPTTASALHAGLAYRLSLTDTLQLQLSSVYAQRSFTVEDAGDGTPKPTIPSVAYQRLDFGLDLRWQLVPRFALHARAAYLLVLNSGELSSDAFFPNASVNGIQADLGIALALVGPLKLDLGVALERYGASFNTQTGDPFIAGGAIDQYVLATLGLVVVLP